MIREEMSLQWHENWQAGRRKKNRQKKVDTKTEWTGQHKRISSCTDAANLRMGYVKATHTRRTNITQKKINLLVHHQHQTDSADERAWHRSRRFTWWERARQRERERKEGMKNKRGRTCYTSAHSGTLTRECAGRWGEVKGCVSVCVCLWWGK